MRIKNYSKFSSEALNFRITIGLRRGLQKLQRVNSTNNVQNKYGRYFSDHTVFIVDFGS